MTDICYEFIWFRTNLKKSFYMLNQETNEKLTSGRIAPGSIPSTDFMGATPAMDYRPA